MVKNKKTNKNWLITDFVSSHSTLNKKAPDVFSVRLSNGSGKSITVDVKELKNKFSW